MDREMIADHLALAEQHVSEGDGIVQRQRDIVATLSRKGRETVRANELLAALIAIQRTHVADRDRLRRELAVYDAQGQ